MADVEEKRAYRVSGKVKMEGRELELYCSPADAATLLGIGRQQVVNLCVALGKKAHSTGLRITASDLYAMVKISRTMAEFDCTTKTAIKILARIDELKKGQAA